MPKLGEIHSDKDGNIKLELPEKDPNNKILELIDEKFKKLNENLKEENKNIKNELNNVKNELKELKKEEKTEGKPKEYQVKKTDFIFSKGSKLVKDNRDHYPINTEGRAKNALARAAQTGGKAPTWFKGTYTQFRTKVISAVKRKYPSIKVTTKFENPRFQTICKLSDISKKKLSENTKSKGGTVIEIEMIRSGVFEHPWYGKLNWNKKKFLNMIKNFKNDVIGRELSIDFNHNNMSVAGGWMKKLYLKNNKYGGVSLMSKTELTKVGENALRDKLYKYFSIEWDENYVEKEGEGNGRGKYGPTLLGGGLTNRPYIDKLTPILIENNGVKTKDRLELKKAA